MDRVSFAVRGWFRMGMLCAGAIVGIACGRAGVTGPTAVVGPSAAAVENVTGSAAGSERQTTQSFGLTPAELKDRGWSCRLTPAGSTACSPPGRGLPVFGAPEDRPPSYHVQVFDTATSQYLGYGRMIRTDLYEGQICPSTGKVYTELALIGYFECFNPVS